MAYYLLARGGKKEKKVLVVTASNLCQVTQGTRSSAGKRLELFLLHAGTQLVGLGFKVVDLNSSTSL